MHSPRTSARYSLLNAGVASVFGFMLAMGLQPIASAQAGQPSIQQPNGSNLPEGRLNNSQNATGSVISVPEDFASLKLGPGFLLNIVVYDEPDFSGPARIDNDGNLTLAFLKPVHVAGDNVAQAKEALQKAFKEQGILAYFLLHNP